MSERYGVGVYRKRPIHVTALLWTGANFVNMERFLESPRNGFFREDQLYLYAGDTAYRVVPGTWIIKAATGGYHPCRADVFENLYEFIPAEDLTSVMHHPV